MHSVYPLIWRGHHEKIAQGSKSVYKCKRQICLDAFGPFTAGRRSDTYMLP